MTVNLTSQLTLPGEMVILSPVHTCIHIYTPPSTSKTQMKSWLPMAQLHLGYSMSLNILSWPQAPNSPISQRKAQVGFVAIQYGIFDWVEYPHQAMESFAQHSWAHLLGGSLWVKLAFRISWTFSSLELENQNIDWSRHACVQMLPLSLTAKQSWALVTN